MPTFTERSRMPLTRAQIRCVLTIAGSDSGGGTGLQADLKTFLCHRVHGAVAVTSVTAQDTTRVSAVERLPGHMVRAQIEAVLEDLAPEAAKTGYLAGPEAMAAVRDLLPRLPPLVVDPVCVDRLGRPFLDPGTLETLRADLIPHAVLVTPNIHEAALLSGREVRERGDMPATAEAILSRGARAVLIKGGRLAGARSPDLLVTTDGIREWFDAPRVNTTAVRGAGDTLSAAIAARLAQGMTLRDAVWSAKTYVGLCLEQAMEIGRGQGPIGHVPAP
ncbi:MAG TPA: bifunctional hydroxymethylpyrimidine kinase/phosphomethylpyrimidine kinase [Chloroflexota bacterium]|nr:bifunctional hydroxymethylpyrimidine kinase/phosphomethylpyrimidine kinase [Chloroflexota bacterium]